jgi:enoyl-CoA hydratase
MAADGWRALNAVRNFPAPVVAALNGDALGGGAELAVACDFRVAARHARIGFLQSNLNISSAWGGGGDLFDLVGRKRALRLLCTAELVSPPEALAMGLFDKCADADSGFVDTVESFLGLMTNKSSQVLKAYKGMATQVRLSANREILERVERDAFVRTWTHPDHWSAADNILNKSN